MFLGMLIKTEHPQSRTIHYQHIHPHSGCRGRRRYHPPIPRDAPEYNVALDGDDDNDGDDYHGDADDGDDKACPANSPGVIAIVMIPGRDAFKFDNDGADVTDTWTDVVVLVLLPVVAFFPDSLIQCKSSGRGR